MHKLLACLLILVPVSECLTLQRRALFKFAATAASVTAAQAANAVPAFLEGVPVEGAEPGRAPNQPPSGPLANTPLGFKVGGGARPEEEVRKIDEARYRAARGPDADKTPSFLDGVPREPLPETR